MKIEAKNFIHKMNSHVIKYHRNARNCCLKLEDQINKIATLHLFDSLYTNYSRF